MSESDWVQWHEAYKDPASAMSQRLAAVQHQIRSYLDERPPGSVSARRPVYRAASEHANDPSEARASDSVRVISMCAGQGRDLIGVLAGHPRRHDVTGRLVEFDPRLAADAEASARAAGLTGLSVRVADAGQSDSYAGAVPADLVLVCGVFGNITDSDIRHTIGFLPRLCAPGATVIWTRTREAPDLVPTACDWFAAGGFALRFLSDPSEPYGMGVHTLVDPPTPFTPGERLFTFVR
ncbi:SAM-dependent methyltransferase [Micromonospora sp. CPCC 206061]|uniref:SAM-dependent methyltransferase n=1 Tax=Micromonospora sp. CPCC 206061 TaxID=3122410 RepID=UPI002FF30CC5